MQETVHLGHMLYIMRAAITRQMSLNIYLKIKSKIIIKHQN